MIYLRTRNHSRSSPHLSRGFFICLRRIFLDFLPNKLRTKHVIAAWLILVSLLSTTAAASSARASSPVIQGQTVDMEGQIIPYVSLVFMHSEIFLLSDEQGYFTWSTPIFIQDSVLVQRIGYQKQIITTAELQHKGRVELVPDVLSMKTVEVQAEAISGASIALPSLSRYSKTSGSGTVDHGRMLSRIAGISVRTYGGPAGISTLSMDGGPSSHTKVMVNDIDITSAQNGEADLSQLPLPFVQSMNYTPFDISQSNSGTMDGIVRLKSSGQPNQVSLSNGSFGHLAYDVNIGKQILGFSNSLQFGQRRENGDYPVIWDHKESLRQNNDLDQQFAALHVRGMLRSNLFWQLTAMHSQQSRGVAGLVWSPDTLSHRNDELQLAGSTLGWIRPGGSTRLQMTVRHSQENYVNPFLRLDSDHELLNLHGEVNDRRSLGKSLVLLSNFAADQDMIRSSETAEHTRNSYRVSITPIIKLVRRIKFISSLKLLRSPDLYEQSLLDLQLQIPLKLGPLSSIAASRGERYRYPSFNDLYWQPGGNPNLEAEKSRITTVQLQFHLNALGKLMLQWQSKESTNLIQWLPVHSYWQPGNVQSASRESRKLIWQLDQPDLHLSAFAHLSLINAVDNDRQKPLRYAPKQTSAFGLTWSPPPFEVNLQYSYVSDRISMYDYPVDTILDATELWSLSFAHTWLFRFGSLTLVLSGENLKDIRYETIRGYPEPGRSFRLTTTFTL